MNALFDITGKVVVMTGGTGVLGRPFTARFLFRKLLHFA